MKAISLWQPWATWVALAWKTVETRTHKRLAGLVGETIAIHATARPGPTAEYRRVQAAYLAASPYMQRNNWENIARLCTHYPYGAVVATAKVCDFRPLGEADSQAAMIYCGKGFDEDPHPQRYGLFLRNIEQVEPSISAKGARGIWHWKREGVRRA